MSQQSIAKHLGRRRANPAFPTGYRRFAPAAPGFTSERAFVYLSGRLGVSAATTYASQRERGSMSVVEALVIARIQARTLGTGYPGGLECTPFRANRKLAEKQREAVKWEKDRKLAEKQREALAKAEGGTE